MNFDLAQSGFPTRMLYGFYVRRDRTESVLGPGHRFSGH
jgi:hypothetical protein